MTPTAISHEDYTMNDEHDLMLRWFLYAHIPKHLHPMTEAIYRLAERIDRDVQPGPERTVAFRKLLECSDAALRALNNPGA